jgi:2-keto-3-deoxy-L-rhamnonate aldolase RhmA
MFRPNSSKSRLRNDEPVFGLVHTLAHPPVAEMIGIAGYDFVVVDGEHGIGGESQNTACLQALAATSATAILRVPSHDLVPVRRALDAGAEGILVPDVRNAAQAAAIAATCFYPPRGTRGFSAGTIRASDYGLNVEDYVGSGGRELLVCAMIESAEGVDNVGEIAAIDGIDVIQVGPFDLSCELGIPGQFEHPDFRDALRRIEAGTSAADKILGGVPLPGLGLGDLLERGYRMITLGADVAMLAGALKDALAVKNTPRD